MEAGTNHLCRLSAVKMLSGTNAKNKRPSGSFSPSFKMEIKGKYPV
jgi:hypothetical protein